MSQPEKPQPQPQYPPRPSDAPPNDGPAVATRVPRVRAMREFLANGEAWLVGECPDDPETGRPIELLFVPADGPIGVPPQRLFSPVALTMLTNLQLVALLARAR